MPSRYPCVHLFHFRPGMAGFITWLEVGPAMSDPTINLKAKSASSELVLQQYRDNESGDLIESIPANKSPIPEVDEIVYFGQMSVSGQAGLLDDIGELDVEDEQYVVRGRTYTFLRTNVETNDTDHEEEALVTNVNIFVSPLGQVENRERDETSQSQPNR